MNSTRVFVAVELDPGTIAALDRVVQQLRSKLSGVRWTRPEQLHLTLKFIGETDNRLLPQLCTGVREACAGIAPFRLGVSGLGAFPKDKAPRVLWAGIDEGAAELRRLAERLEAQLADLGIPRESRLYTPHLTLGRFGRGASRENVGPILDSLSARVQAHTEIDQVVLMSSLREQGETVYEPIDTIDLLD